MEGCLRTTPAVGASSFPVTWLGAPRTTVCIREGCTRQRGIGAVGWRRVGRVLSLRLRMVVRLRRSLKVNSLNIYECSFLRLIPMIVNVLEEYRPVNTKEMEEGASVELRDSNRLWKIEAYGRGVPVLAGGGRHNPRVCTVSVPEKTPSRTPGSPMSEH